MSVNSTIWYKQWWALTIFAVGTFFLILLVAYGFYVYELSRKISSGEIISPNLTMLDEKTYDAGGSGNFWMGSSNPKLTIVYFADFACSYCKKSYTKIREIGTVYKEDVRIVFRDYPLHEESLNLAMAGRCAGEQGLFWLMHDKLFQNQGVKTNEQLSSLAVQIGADQTKFDRCMTDRKYIAQIQKDLIDGQKLDLKGTPTWFFNGHRVDGDIPYNYFQAIVNKFIY